MSMTREEAIVQIQGLKKYCEDMADSDESGSYVFDLDVQALDLALFSLRPVSREQVGKMWKGCGICEVPTHWLEWGEKRYMYCPYCGRPLTGYSEREHMERLEALHDTGN